MNRATEQKNQIVYNRIGETFDFDVDISNLFLFIIYLVHLFIYSSVLMVNTQESINYKSAN